MHTLFSIMTLLETNAPAYITIPVPIFADGLMFDRESITFANKYPSFFTLLYNSLLYLGSPTA